MANVSDGGEVAESASAAARPDVGRLDRAQAAAHAAATESASVRWSTSMMSTNRKMNPKVKHHDAKAARRAWASQSEPSSASRRTAAMGSPCGGYVEAGTRVGAVRVSQRCTGDRGLFTIHVHPRRFSGRRNDFMSHPMP